MAKINACFIVNKEGRNVDGRIWKTCSKARSHIKSVVKNNSIEQRKMTGFVGLKVKKVRSLYPRQEEELKKVKDFIRD